MTAPTKTALRSGEIHSDEHGVTLRWEVYSHHLDFKAKEGCRQPDDSILYMALNPHGVPEPAEGFDGGERFVDGWIKWDGCSHLYFGDEDGYLHVCGGRCFRALEWAMRTAWERTVAEVPSFDQTVASEWK